LLESRLIASRAASAAGAACHPAAHGGAGGEQAGEKVDTGKITKILHRHGGAGTQELATAEAGDIVQIAGLSKATVSDTICAPEVTTPIPTVMIDPPTVSMTFSPNDSPLQGRDGTKLTSQMIWDRLAKEMENNISIKAPRPARTPVY
jgi:GTP-binding protein